METRVEEQKDLRNLQDLKELALRAYNWSSFDPERRAEQTIKEHQAMLNKDLESIPDNEQERYICKFRELYCHWLQAHANCVNWAVTGRSGLNIRRVEKANNRERGAYTNFMEWREKAIKAIKKRIEQSKTPETVSSEAWQKLERDITSSAQVIISIIKGEYCGSKPLFIANLYARVETYAKHGNTEIVAKAIDLVREINKEKVIITERHKFFKLLEMAEARKSRSEERANKENKEISFEGGKIVHNYSLDRLQILFDEKPSVDIRTKIRNNGFIWSPTNGAWQRKLTNNAIYVLERLIKL